MRTIMVASTGTPIDAAVIGRALEVAAERPTKVLVLSVAKIWGTRLGMPNPMLYPSKREMDEQRDICEEAARVFRQHGVPAKTKVVGSRSAGKSIASWAEFLGCSAIVVGAPVLSRGERLLRGDEPNRIAKKTKLHVYTVPLDPPPKRKPTVRR